MVRFRLLLCIKKVQGFDAPVLVLTAEHYFYLHGTSYSTASGPENLKQSRQKTREIK